MRKWKILIGLSLYFLCAKAFAEDIPYSAKEQMIYGHDGSAITRIKTDSDGKLEVIQSGTGTVDINDISKGTQTNDVKVTLDSEAVTLNALPTGTNIMGAIKNAGVNYTTIYKQANYAAAQTDTTIWDPAAGKKVVITDIILSAEGACNIFLEVGATVILPKMYFADNGGMAMPLQAPIKCATDGVLTITSSAAVNHSIFLSGYEE